MALHLTGHRRGFAPGLTEITKIGEAEHDTGIGLSVLKLATGESSSETAPSESAWLHMSGRAKLRVGALEATWERQSLFDEMPYCLHVAAGTEVSFEALTDIELTIYRVANQQRFEPRLFGPGDVGNEARGAGQVGDACLRYVRTIFDDTNSEPTTDLVLGEVITLPGRWSSYPPHHHPQPEIYHYRFTEPQGYGHAELGDDVLKVCQYDTVKIFDGNDHAQAAAPGYGMYYSWVIRHLPGNRYQTPVFTEAHTWTMQEGARFWQPK